MTSPFVCHINILQNTTNSVKGGWEKFLSHSAPPGEAGYKVGDRGVEPLWDRLKAGCMTALPTTHKLL